MKRPIIIFLLLTGCYNDEKYTYCIYDYKPEHINSRIGTGKTVLIMGDSRGWNGGTWDALPFTVYNVAQGGSTTRGTIMRLHFVQEINPDVVVIFSGPNDAIFLSPEEYAENLTHLKNKIESLGIRVIFSEFGHNPSMPNILYAADKMIARSFAEYVPIELTEDDFVDMVHFSELGMQKVSDALVDAIGI